MVFPLCNPDQIIMFIEHEQAKAFKISILYAYIYLDKLGFIPFLSNVTMLFWH